MNPYASDYELRTLLDKKRRGETLEPEEAATLAAAPERCLELERMYKP